MNRENEHLQIFRTLQIEKKNNLNFIKGFVKDLNFHTTPFNRVVTPAEALENPGYSSTNAKRVQFYAPKYKYIMYVERLTNHHPVNLLHEPFLSSFHF